MDVEGTHRLTDPRAAAPVGNMARDDGGFADAVPGDLAGDASETRGEHERFKSPPTLNGSADLIARDAVNEVQQHPRVAFHRPADVGDDHERPRPGRPSAGRDTQRLTTV